MTTTKTSPSIKSANLTTYKASELKDDHVLLTAISEAVKKRDGHCLLRTAVSDLKITEDMAGTNVRSELLQRGHKLINLCLKNSVRFRRYGRQEIEVRADGWSSPIPTPKTRKPSSAS